MALQEKTEDWLLPYLEGAYAADPARQAACEARLAADPALTAEAAQMRQTLNAVRGVAARTPRSDTATVPADSWPRLKARLQPAPSRRLSWGWLGGAGAAVAAGVLAVVLPGTHQKPPIQSSVQVATTPRPVPLTAPTPPAVSAGQKSAQVAQTAPPKTPTGPLVPPNPNGLNDPFLTPPIPPPHPGASAAKSSPPVVVKPLPKTNQQIASRDLNGSHSPEVISPLLPLPVPQSTAPMPVAPPLPTPAPQTRFERKFALPTPAAQPTPPADSIAANARIQTFSGEAPPSAAPAPPVEPYKLPPPAAAVGGGFGGGPGRAMNRMAVPPRRAPTSADNVALLTAGTKSMTEAVGPPLWGKTEGMQQSNETLTDLREAGLLDDLRAKLEARRTQMPNDLATGRMLAAVYDFSGTADAARHERERIAGLDGANGEDFFQLAQSEERAGNVDAARAAYRRALTAPVPPTGFHAAIARQKAQ